MEKNYKVKITTQITHVPSSGIQRNIKRMQWKAHRKVKFGLQHLSIPKKLPTIYKME